MRPRLRPMGGRVHRATEADEETDEAEIETDGRQMHSAKETDAQPISPFLGRIPSGPIRHSRANRNLRSAFLGS